MLLYKLFENWEPQKFEQHFKDVQRFYRERRDIMITMLKKHLSGMLIIIFKKFVTITDVKTILLNPSEIN